MVHGPSGKVMETDAPKDNMGQGESFSPTDLVGSALLSCMLTTMAIVAQKDDLEFGPCEGTVTKEMVADPRRRIGKLTVSIQMPKGLLPEQRKKLEHVALTCPVTQSLNPKVEIPTSFHYSN